MKLFELFQVNVLYSYLVKKIKTVIALYKVHQLINIMLVKSCAHSFQFSLQCIFAFLSNFSFFFFKRILYFTFCFSSNNKI